MNLKYAEKLEYPTILEKLSSYCHTDLGKNLCLCLKPSSNNTIVSNLLQETQEAIKLLLENKPYITNISDISYSLKILNSNGTLPIKSILELAQILKMSSMLKDYFYLDREVANFSIMDSYFSKLYTNPSIVKTIEASIVDENTVLDSASSNLLSIRRQKRKLEENIKEKLNHFIHSSTYSKYIQENVVTIRNNRYVIPIKEEYRGMVKGFVHDISASRFYYVYRTNGGI